MPDEEDSSDVPAPNPGLGRQSAKFPAQQRQAKIGVVSSGIIIVAVVLFLIFKGY